MIDLRLGRDTAHRLPSGCSSSSYQADRSIRKEAVSVGRYIVCEKVALLPRSRYPCPDCQCLPGRWTRRNVGAKRQGMDSLRASRQPCDPATRRHGLPFSLRRTLRPRPEGSEWDQAPIYRTRPRASPSRLGWDGGSVVGCLVRVLADGAHPPIGCAQATSCCWRPAQRCRRTAT